MRYILLLALASTAFAGSYKLVGDTLDLEVGSYRYIKFRVTPEQTEARVLGVVSTEPDSLPVELILLTEWNYLTAWHGSGDLDTLAVRRDGTGEVEMEIPDYGDYVLVVSNRGNFQRINVAADLRVVFSGTGIAYDSLPAGMSILMTVLACALVVAAILLTVKKLT